jgi:hypothetical protein
MKKILDKYICTMEIEFLAILEDSFKNLRGIAFQMSNNNCTDCDKCHGSPTVQQINQSFDNFIDNLRIRFLYYNSVTNMKY